MNQQNDAPRNYYGQPLWIGLRDGKLVIEIGVEALAHAAQVSENFREFDDKSQDWRLAFRVTNPEAFAKDVALGLQQESEDGSTNLTRSLDAACVYAIESASAGVEEVEYEEPSE